MPQSILFGLIAMVAFGLSQTFLKKPSQEVGTQKAVFLRGVFVAIIFAPIVVLQWELATSNINMIILSCFLGLFGYIPMYFLTRAIEIGKIGVVVPVTNTSVVFSTLSAVVVFGETLTMLSVVAIILILAGVVTISLKKSDFQNFSFKNLPKGVPHAFIAATAMGIMFTLLAIPVSKLGPIAPQFFAVIATTLAAAFAVKRSKQQLFTYTRKSFTMLAAVGVLWAITIAAFGFGIQYGNISIVSAIMFANPLVSVLIGRYVFGEHLSKQQYTAAGIIIAGVILLALA